MKNALRRLIQEFKIYMDNFHDFTSLYVEHFSKSMNVLYKLLSDVKL